MFFSVSQAGFAATPGHFTPVMNEKVGLSQFPALVRFRPGRGAKLGESGEWNLGSGG